MEKIDPDDKINIILYQDTTPTPEQSDECVDMYFLLPSGGGWQLTVVSHCKLYESRNNIGRQKYNPLLDTRLYGVALYNNEVQEIAANRVSEYIF